MAPQPAMMSPVLVPSLTAASYSVNLSSFAVCFTRVLGLLPSYREPVVAIATAERCYAQGRELAVRGLTPPPICRCHALPKSH